MVGRMTPFRATPGFTDDWKHFRFEIADGVAHHHVRPTRTSSTRLTFDVYADLRDLLAELPHRDDVRVLVITGQGPRLLLGRRRPRDHRRAAEDGCARSLLDFTRMTGAVVQRMRECPVPIIASINGIAAGAGSVIALAADFRVLARSASLAVPVHEGRPRRRRHGIRLSASPHGRAVEGHRAVDPRRRDRARSRPTRSGSPTRSSTTRTSQPPPASLQRGSPTVRRSPTRAQDAAVARARHGPGRRRSSSRR